MRSIAAVKAVTVITTNPMIVPAIAMIAIAAIATGIRTAMITAMVIANRGRRSEYAQGYRDGYSDAADRYSGGNQAYEPGYHPTDYDDNRRDYSNNGY